MDTVQPQLIQNRMGGGTGSISQARFIQDIYRAVKTPNFSVSRSAQQIFSTSLTTWNLVTWDTIQHNYLNCFNVSENSCHPSVPGLYHLSCQIPWYTVNDRPKLNTLIRLAFTTPNGVVRAETAYEAAGEVWEKNRVLYLTCTCLDYLDGKGENAYRQVRVFQNTDTDLYVPGSSGTAGHTSRFQAFKIAY